MYHATVQVVTSMRYAASDSYITSHPSPGFFSTTTMLLRPRHTDTDNLERQILVGGTIGIVIAASATVVRLSLRIRKLGGDDALAFVALLCLILTGVSGKLYYSINDRSGIPHNSRIALYYILAVGFDLTIWMSRISVLFGIIRFGRYKRQLYCATVLFLLAMFILVAQVFWVCEPQDRRTHWKSKVIPQCVLGRSVAIVQVTTDALADAVLITVPLLIMRSLKSSDTTALRVRLSASFAIGGLTTIVSIVHAFYLWQDTQVSIIVSNAELAVSLIICNFFVLAAAAHRLWTKLHPPLKAQIPQNSIVQIEFAPRTDYSQAETTTSGTLSDGSKGNRCVGADAIEAVETHKNEERRTKDYENISSSLLEHH